MLKTIIFATTNKDKVREIKEIVGEGCMVLTMSEIGFFDDIEEDGTTFVENATIKAKAVADYINALKPEYSNSIVLADDSGLEIDYYDKKPGVYSHRWLGDMTYREKMEEVIEDMKDVPEEKRTCRFVCAMAAIILPGMSMSVTETVEGVVAHEIVGDNGFGYDPFFYVPEFGCTTAQMDPYKKNEISHRGKALTKILERLYQNQFAHTDVSTE